MSVVSSIPFVDLVTPHLELEQELTAVFRQALRTAGFIGGRMVEEFEVAFADFCGADHAIAISSGTDALRFAIMASGVQAGDVVETVPNTFIATTEAISQAGAFPEFVDIDEYSYNLSVNVTKLPGKTMLSRQSWKTHQSAKWKAGDSHRAGPPVRTDGRHGPDSEPGRGVWSECD